MLGVRPAGRDPTGAHATPRLAILDRKGDVAEYEHADGEGEPVVDERRAGAPGQPGQTGVVHEQSAAQQYEDCPGGQGGVQLLAGVELADANRSVAPSPGPQPSPVG